MLRHNVPVRRDLDQIAADNGFDFHIIDNEIYWDESRAYRFTLRQIEEQKYEETLRQEGYQNIMKYGIAFYRKECMAKLGQAGSESNTP